MAYPQISIPTVQRLAQVYARLGELRSKGTRKVSSTQLGKELGTGSHNIRKDFSVLGEGAGQAGAAYDVEFLRNRIQQRFGLGRTIRACIVGLGRLGTAIADYDSLRKAGCDIVAGFDSNINRVETIRIGIPVHPAYQISQVVRNEGIELGILTVPVFGAQEATNRLVQGGVQVILNFVPSKVDVPSGVVVRNIDMITEYLIASAFVTLKSESQNDTEERI